jgi:hypothetical protein
MAHIESIRDTLFTPLSRSQSLYVTGGVVAPSKTYERVADIGPNGEFIGWGYVQVD